nr:PCMD domain-containing protein [uncultured Bacteroides sp.]
MKKIYLFLTILLTTWVAVSCQQEDLEGNIGYLRIEVGTNAYVDTKAIPGNYNPQQIAVQIINSTGEVVERTDDWEMWQGQQFRLTPGVYTIQASSNGFDGSESGFDVPYYAGSQQITVETGKEVTANITCTLANVKVTVNYDESFQKFATATTNVSSALEGVAALDFVMGNELKPGYFPVGDLTVTVNVTNKAGEKHSQSTSITDVKARKHYILNFKVADAGFIEKPTITINGEEIIFNFTFNVSTEISTQLKAQSANAWSNFAYVEGEVTSDEGEIDPTAMRFEYKTAEAAEWTTTTAQFDESTKKYKSTLNDLTPATTYNYRIVYEKDGELCLSDAVTFTTEAATALPNGNLDDWYHQGGKVWYAVSEADYNSVGSFWDSGNKGGSTLGKNPTQGNSETVHTPNGKSAELKSQFVGIIPGIGQFAAGNLYAGTFGEVKGMDGASLYFGQPFTSRPSALHGWYNYTSGKINYHGSNTPEGEGLEGTDDLCAIYVALSTERILIDNTDLSTFPDWGKDERIIAYSRMDDADAVTTNGWKEFTLDFKYRSLEPLDTYYLIIVFSASKYGDYFTGSTNSVMYIDDLELVYGQPTVQE